MYQPFSLVSHDRFQLENLISACTLYLRELPAHENGFCWWYSGYELAGGKTLACSGSHQVRRVDA